MTKLLVTIAGLPFIAIFLFGIFSLLSKQFKYFGPETNEYNKDRNKEQSIFIIFEDRLQARINSSKVIFYNDIFSITAIPNCFIDDDIKDVIPFCFIEIKYSANQKVVLTDGYKFFEQFQQNQNTTVRKLPTVKEIEDKFGKGKFISASLLFQASPVKIDLWTREV